MNAVIERLTEDLPASWRWERIDTLCEIQLGKMLSPAAKVGSSPLPYLRNQNVQWSRFDLRDIAHMDFSETEQEKFMLRKGDLLVCEGGEPGRAAVWNGEIEPCFYQKALHRLRPKDNLVDPHFLMYRLRLGALSGEFSGSNAKTTIAHLPLVRLASLRVATPPLKEQKRIAAMLNEQMAALNGTRESQAQCVKLATALSTSYLQSIFPVGLGNTVPIASSWRRTALGDASDVVSGVTVGRQLREPTTRRVPYLRVANVKDGYLDLSEIKSIDVTENELQKWRLLDGDILLTEGGDLDKLGRGTFWSEQILDCIHQNHIFRVRFKSHEVYPPFVAAQLGSPYGKEYFLRHAKKTTGIASINQKVLRGFPLLLPPIEEQRRVAERLQSQQGAAAAMTAEFRQQSEALDRMPAALLRQAFAGGL